jgi:hypothetical protein
MVQARGLEPPYSCEHMDLNRARLPIPPCLPDVLDFNIEKLF